MSQYGKRFLSLLLAFAMVFSILPVSALATEDDDAEYYAEIVEAAEMLIADAWDYIEQKNYEYAWDSIYAADDCMAELPEEYLASVSNYADYEAAIEFLENPPAEEEPVEEEPEEEEIEEDEEIIEDEEIVDNSKNLLAEGEETDAKPNATVTLLKPITLTAAKHGYMVWPNGDDTIDRPLQIVMNFKANETLEQAQAGAFGKFKCDFYLTVTGLANGSLVADECYLAGNYGSFGWIVIPADGLVIEDGMSYPVVSAYDANLTYEDICKSVKNFTAAIYIAPELLTANPDMQVTLELKMVDPEDETNVLVIGDPAVYNVEALNAAVNPEAPEAPDVPAVSVTVPSDGNVTVSGAVTEEKKAEIIASIVNADVQAPAIVLDNVATMDVAVPAGVEVAATTTIELKSFAVDANKVPTKVTYNVSPKLVWLTAAGEKSAKVTEFTDPITIQLPVPSGVTCSRANVYHGDEFVTNVEIKGQENKYIEFEASEFSEYHAEFTNKSTPTAYVAQVGTEKFETLAAAIAAAETGDTVTLLGDVLLTGKLTIGKSITIDGNGHSIKADENAVWYTVSGSLNIKNYKTHLIGVNANGITLKNVVLDCNSNAAGINIYCAQNVTFDNVQIINATKGTAALTVNGSTLTVKTSFKALGHSTAIDASNGSGVTSTLGVTVEEGTVLDLADKTVKFASVANMDMTGAVTAAGERYFAAKDNAYFYTESQMNSRTTAYSNGITLLDDVVITNAKFSVKGVLDLNDHTLTIQDGTVMKVANNLEIKNGTFNGAIELTKTGITLTAPAGLQVAAPDGNTTVFDSVNNKYYAVAAAAKVGDTEYESIAAAMAAAKEAGVTDLVITIIGENDSSSEDTFDLAYGTAFENVTIKQDNGGKPYYMAGIYTGDRTVSGGQFVLDGVNIISTRNIWFECEVVLKNNSVLTRPDDSKNFVFYGDLIIEPGSKFISQIDDVMAGSMTVDGGKTDGTYSTDPDYRSIFVDVRAGQTLTLQNGAYVLFNAANEIGRLILDGNAVVTASKLDVFNNIVMGSNASLKTDVNSQISAQVITGGGVITIDASALTDKAVTVITADMSGFTGTVEVVNNANAFYEITNSGIVVKTAVAKIGTTYYVAFADALAAAQPGETVTLLADVTASAAIVLDKAITLDGNKKVLTSTADRAINVNCAGEVTIKDLTIATTNKTERAVNVIQKAAKLTLENVTAEGFKYTINVAASSKGSDITINGGKFSGYAAMNITGSNTAVTANNAELIGVNDAAASATNEFAVISIGDYTSGETTENVSVTVNGGKLTATSENGNEQFILTASAVTGTTAVIDAELSLCEGAVFNGDTSLISASFRAEYADELNAQGFITEAAATNGMIKAENSAAKIGENLYKTLDLALAAAQAKDTVVLMADVTTMPESEVGMELTIKVGKNKLWLDNALRALKAIAADGYSVKDNTDGTYTFEKVNVVVNGEASIGATVYATLSEAISAANNGAFIQILKNVETKPEVTIAKNLVIVTNGYTLWNEDAQVALTEITDTAYGVESNWGMFFISRLPDGQKNVASLNGKLYTTVKAALDVAKSGETVTMIADSDETDSGLMINKGVTLNMVNFDLKARSITGANGAFIYGDAYHATKDYATLVAETLILGETAPEIDGYKTIPIYAPNKDCYVFTKYILRTDNADTGLTLNKEAKQIYFQFAQQLTGEVRTGLMKDKYTAEDNKLKVVVRVNWSGDTGVYEQNYVYKDGFVQGASENTSTHYTFTLNGYDKLGLTEENMDSFKIQAMVITDSGVISYSDDFIASESK